MILFDEKEKTFVGDDGLVADWQVRSWRSSYDDAPRVICDLTLYDVGGSVAVSYEAAKQLLAVLDNFVHASETAHQVCVDESN